MSATHFPLYSRQLLSRRRLMIAGGLLAQSPFFINRQPEAQTTEASKMLSEVASGAFVQQGAHQLMLPINLGHIANVGCVIGNDAVAVIDSGGSALHGKQLRQAIRTVTDRPIRYVIATHVHPDHLFGHAAFLGDEPIFVGHRKLPSALEARGGFYLNNLRDEFGDLAAGTEVVMPDLLVDDEATLDLGNRTLALKAYPTAHTDNDMTVLDQNSGLLWAGDLLFMERCPVLDGSLLGWLDVLEGLPTIGAKTVVPGHGPVTATFPDALAAEVRYLTRLRDDLRRFLDEGGLLEDAVASLAFEDERDQWQLFEHYHGRNVSAAYAELEWE